MQAAHFVCGLCRTPAQQLDLLWDLEAAAGRAAGDCAVAATAVREAYRTIVREQGGAAQNAPSISPRPAAPDHIAAMAPGNPPAVTPGRGVVAATAAPHVQRWTDAPIVGGVKAALTTATASATDTTLVATAASAPLVPSTELPSQRPLARWCQRCIMESGPVSRVASGAMPAHSCGKTNTKTLTRSRRAPKAEENMAPVLKGTLIEDQASGALVFGGEWAMSAAAYAGGHRSLFQYTATSTAATTATSTTAMSTTVTSTPTNTNSAPAESSGVGSAPPGAAIGDNPSRPAETGISALRLDGWFELRAGRGSAVRVHETDVRLTLRKLDHCVGPGRWDHAVAGGGQNQIGKFEIAGRFSSATRKVDVHKEYFSHSQHKPKAPAHRRYRHAPVSTSARQRGAQQSEAAEAVAAAVAAATAAASVGVVAEARPPGRLFLIEKILDRQTAARGHENPPPTQCTLSVCGSPHRDQSSAVPPYHRTPSVRLLWHRPLAIPPVTHAHRRTARRGCS